MAKPVNHDKNHGAKVCKPIHATSPLSPKRANHHKKQHGLRVGIAGASGLVGREMITALHMRGFPVQSLTLFSRRMREPLKCEWGTLAYRPLRRRDLAKLDVLLLATPSVTSEKIVAAARDYPLLVIDNSEAFRLHERVPLVVPEVNGAWLTNQQPCALLANPNCVVIGLMVALSPLHAAAECQELVVATYQSVSGAGAAAQHELLEQTRRLLGGMEPAPSKALPRRIAFNCIPQVGQLQADGHSSEESKIGQESQKILQAPSLSVSSLCVRVPVFVGHGIAVHARFRRALSQVEAIKLLRVSPGVVICDQSSKMSYPTLLDVQGSEAVWVGRIRNDEHTANHLNFFCASDNLRKGAASNAVQIAELALQVGWLPLTRPPKHA